MSSGLTELAKALRRFDSPIPGDEDLIMRLSAQRIYELEATIAMMDELTDRQSIHLCELAHEVSGLKQQLATCCALAETSTAQAQAFAGALDELKGSGAGYWPNEPKAVP